MLSLSFTMHRFLCSAMTFASLFEPDSRGHSIPETASFECVWARVPRASHRELNSVHIKQEGGTSKSYFKVSGSDMVLYFSGDPVILSVAVSDVIMFQLRPSVFGANSAPVLAKGTIDPTLYTEKPRTSYLISLRDALEEVLGTLSLSLKVNIDSGSRVTDSHSTRNHDSQYPHPLQLMSSPELLERDLSHRNRMPYTTSIASSRGQLIEYRNDEGRMDQQVLELVLEHVKLDSDSADAARVLPFVPKAEYNMKVQYGGITYTTSRVVCDTPKEVNFLKQKIYITMLPSGSREKLRFSLWENGRQVSGFSVDLMKLRADAGLSTEYTVPFRHHPTQRSVALGLSVRKTGAIGVQASQSSMTPLRRSSLSSVPIPKLLGSRESDVLSSSVSGVLKRGGGGATSSHPLCESPSQELQGPSRASTSQHPTSFNKTSLSRLENKSDTNGVIHSRVEDKVERNLDNRRSMWASNVVSSDVRDPRGHVSREWRPSVVAAKGSPAASRRGSHSIASAASSRLNSAERGRGSPAVRSTRRVLSIDMENSMGRLPYEHHCGTPLRQSLPTSGGAVAATSELEAFLYEVVNRIEQRRARAEKRYDSSLSDDWRAWNAEMAGRRVVQTPSVSLNGRDRSHSRGGSLRSRASPRSSISPASMSPGYRPVRALYTQEHRTLSHFSHRKSKDQSSSFW
ncbi:unnamed protein product [Phytomonas sp. EM1]|nr:unnamed protein product [Phytomonas sp. EM1]|eukprot:CCW63275.1 unnamed protein product [Phytomonas sp. isolate EM1]